MALCKLKGIVTRIMHAKYQCSIINTSEDVSRVKVFVTNGRTDRQMSFLNVPAVSQKCWDNSSYFCITEQAF